MFFVLHIGWMVGWITESYYNGWTLNVYWYIWLLLLIASQILRYWCILSLGYYWNTRILVIPGTERVCKGPYSFVKHPNYIAVAIEIISIPLIFNATITALTASMCNAFLLLYIRIPSEEKALNGLKP